jgi:hypothetical protein
VQHVLKSVLDSTQRWSKTDIAPLFELRFRWMTTRWKGNFINFSIELHFDICSVLDREEVHEKRDSKETMRTRKRRWWWQHWREGQTLYNLQHLLYRIYFSESTLQNLLYRISGQTLYNLQHLLYRIYFSATSPLQFPLFYNTVLQVRLAASIDLRQACEYHFTK